MPTNLHKVTQYHWDKNEETPVLKTTESLVNFDHVLTIAHAKGASNQFKIPMMIIRLTSPTENFNMLVSQTDIEKILEIQNNA